MLTDPYLSDVKIFSGTLYFRLSDIACKEQESEDPASLSFFLISNLVGFCLAILASLQNLSWMSQSQVYALNRPRRSTKFVYRAKVHYPRRKTKRLPCLIIWCRWGHWSNLRCPVPTVLTRQPSPPFRRVFWPTTLKGSPQRPLAELPESWRFVGGSGCEGKSSLLQTARLNTLTISGPATQNSKENGLGNPLFWGKGWRLFTSGPDGAWRVFKFPHHFFSVPSRGRQASQQANEQGRKPSSKWARKPSKQASNQASQKSLPPNKQASKPKPTLTKNPPWITMNRA